MDGPAGQGAQMLVAAPSNVARGIGPRVIALILLFSSMVTLVSTLVQLYLDYDHDVRLIENRLDDIQRSSLSSLAVAVWNVDSAGLRIQLEGMLRLPDMQYLEVREYPASVANPLQVAVGVPGARSSVWREYPLIHVERNNPRQVGILRAEASLEGVYQRLQEKVVVILVSQALKTFLVSLFTLYIVHRLITRHLVAVADYFFRYDPRAPPPPLKLHRTRPSHPDELDQLVSAFQSMATGLESAYHELAGLNRELEQDIAERQARERELQQALDNLAAANRELERFAFVASHDLQEPLRSIVSFTQLLSRDYAGKLDGRADEYMGFIVSSGQRMHALINDLLAYSRVDHKGAPFVALDAGSVCSHALQNLAESIAESGAHIQVGELPRVTGDETQLVQLFQQLLGNAVKFRRPGQNPEVTVSAAPAEPGMWRFTIADNGIGMDTAGPDPFAVFRRQHPAHAFPGTGMGLAICKRIVTRHGGTIAVESAVGVGTTFTFTLCQFQP